MSSAKLRQYRLSLNVLILNVYVLNCLLETCISMHSISLCNSVTAQVVGILPRERQGSLFFNAMAVDDREKLGIRISICSHGIGPILPQYYGIGTRGLMGNMDLMAFLCTIDISTTPFSRNMKYNICKNNLFTFQILDIWTGKTICQWAGAEETYPYCHSLRSGIMSTLC